MTCTVDDIDFLYAMSLDEELCEKDKAFISDAMKYVLNECNKLLKCIDSNEIKAKLRILAISAKNTIEEIAKGYDVLLHWSIQREIIIKFKFFNKDIS